jgi:type III pantothenate kinase
MSMLLAIDIGNTNIGLGVFRGTELVASWRLTTQRDRTADELGIMIGELLAHDRVDRAEIRGIVVASVVPPLTTTMTEMARRYFGQIPLTLESGLQTGMPVRYDTPADVGADRVVNAVAAFEHYGRPNGRPVIVVDFGTATTFDAISATGEYLGGVICPGIQISADALFERAARLPRVDVRKPPRVIGTTTVTSMQSGLFFGYVGLVEGIVERMRNELGADAVCIATGGLAEIIAPETRLIEAVDRELTLTGLRMVWERNQERHDQSSVPSPRS